MNKYKIFDVRKSKPGNRLYFFDANVWLLILDPPFKLNHLQQAYIDFWETLVNTSGGTKKIVAINTLLISEIVNTYLRIRFISYKEELVALGEIKANDASKLDFKKDYRGTNHYEENLSNLQDDLSSYSPFIEVIDDNARELELMELFSSMAIDMDFNDLLYYKFCRHYQFPIVTHDGDFLFMDHPILTSNSKLLQNSTIIT